PVTLRTGQEVILVDTEGFSSPDIQDQTLFDQTYARLRGKGTVKRFILVINSAEARFDARFQKMISSFVNMAGPTFLSHLSVVFTRWEHDSKSINRRQRQGSSELNKTNEIRTFLKSKFNHSGDIPCFFVDCGFNEGD